MACTSYKIETNLVHGTEHYDEKTGAVTVPIYQSATFRHPALYETTGYDYSRLQNPTREALEKTVALLEGGDRAFAFSSGMAAITTVIKCFNSGDHIIVSDDIYGGTYRLFNEIYSGYGFEFSFVDETDLEAIKNEIKANTKGIFIETPTNPMMKIADVKAISKISKANNLTLIVDNTFLTPYFQKPFELGADLIVHSGTKYLGGHNDTLAGFIVAKSEKHIEKIELIQKSEGAVLAPLDAWLIMRGIKTLGIRMKKQEENAIQIAKWLNQHPKVSNVYYPGLTTHQGHDIIKNQASGFGAMISFTVENATIVESVLKSIKVIMFAESLGGVETLMTYPMVQTHAAIPEEVRNRIGVTDKLLRLSVGIEHLDDLLNDLEYALR